MDLIVPLRPARLPHRLWHAVFSAGLLLAPVLDDHLTFGAKRASRND